MNLEYDDDELDVLRAAGDVFRKVAPVPLSGMAEPGDRWPALVNLGWADLGTEMSTGALSASLAIDVFRQAGAQLLTEDLTTSAYLLPRMAAAIFDPSARVEIRTRLQIRRGLLLGDGRHRFLPVVSEECSDGLCFGSAGEPDIYRVVDRGGTLLLQCWDGPPAALEPLAGLSRSVTLVHLAGSGPWLDAPLDTDRQQLEVIETEGSLLHAAALIGCGQQILDMTCSYAGSRVQFGVPIASFQAVKHLLADVHTGLAVAWNALLSATADGADSSLAPLVARLLAVDSALAAARAGAQIHGGIGFSADLNLHLFLKEVLDGVLRGGTADDLALEVGRRFMEGAC